MKLFKGDRGRRILEWLLLGVALILIFEAVDNSWSGNWLSVLFGVAAPILAGFFIAFILYIPAQKFEDLLKKTKGFFHRHARGTAVLITYILFIAVIGLVVYAVLPIFIENIVALAKDIPNYAGQASDFMRGLADENGKIFGVDVQTLMTSDIPAAIINFFNVERISDIIGGAYAVGSAIVSSVLAFIISIYMLLDRDGLIGVCGRIFGIFLAPTAVHRVRKYLRKISDIFYSYIYSQLLDSLLVGVVCGIVFSIIGIKYAIFFALLIGLCNLIPYFGAIISGVVISLVTWATGGIIIALITAASIVVIMQIDGNLVQPRIVGRTVGIRPIYVLIAITLGGGLFGFIGMLIGVPVIATLRMMTIDFIAFNNKNRGKKLGAEKE